MSLLDQFRSFVEEPPPAYAFEISAGGVAYAVRPSKASQPLQVHFQPFPQEVLAVSPVRDNVLLPDVFSRHIAALVPPNGHKRRDAAIILPDYCARVAVLDFESFPKDRAEQFALVRFRLKKSVPFDMESAAVSFQVRPTGTKKFEVLVAVAAMEIIARYEAPFRAAGFNPGFSTTSMLATLDLMPAAGIALAAKLSGRALTVCVCDGRFPKLVRTVELDQLSVPDVMNVLFPMVAYAEDELPNRPTHLYTSGFGEAANSIRDASEAELQLPVEPLRSLWGAADAVNSGLLGYFQAQEARA